MTARNVATIVSLTLLAFVSGCTNFFEVPIETPLSPKRTVSWLFPFGTFEKPLNSPGTIEQMSLQTTTFAPPLRKFWNGAYICTST